MGRKDVYDSLIGYYEFQMGRLPHSTELKDALQGTFTPQDLRIFFLLPFIGPMPLEKLLRKGARAGIPAEQIHDTVRRMVPQGVIASYELPAGQVCERQPFIALIELQVRVVEDSPMRAVCTKLMNDFIEGAVAAVPMRTPYYRVLPVESTVTGSGGRRTIQINQPVPDPRQVLPIDIVSEMIRKEPLVAISDCYCRATKQLVGEPCEHPLHTCFYFNELAQKQMAAGYAEQVTHEEAIRVLWECEEHGLIHNVSNCEGHIQTLCNCCTCSCAVMKNQVKLGTHFAGPSRYVIALDASRCDLSQACVTACPMGNFVVDRRLQVDYGNCLGCGLCVSACPSGALHLELRAEAPKIFAHNDDLWRRLNTEAFVGLVKRRLRVG
jgi:Fe-S-cluster-containing hydrogenase component 2